MQLMYYNHYKLGNVAMQQLLHKDKQNVTQRMSNVNIPTHLTHSHEYINEIVKKTHYKNRSDFLGQPIRSDRDRIVAHVIALFGGKVTLTLRFLSPSSFVKHLSRRSIERDAYTSTICAVTLGSEMFPRMFRRTFQGTFNTLAINDVRAPRIVINRTTRTIPYINLGDTKGSFVHTILPLPRRAIP